MKENLPSQCAKRRMVGAKAAFAHNSFLYLRDKRHSVSSSLHCRLCDMPMLQNQSRTELAMYLNEVWKQSSQQHSLQQLLLVAVLIAQRSVLLTFAGMRHQLSFVQVGAELRDET